MKRNKQLLLCEAPKHRAQMHGRKEEETRRLGFFRRREGEQGTKKNDESGQGVGQGSQNVRFGYGRRQSTEERLIRNSEIRCHNNR